MVSLQVMFKAPKEARTILFISRTDTVCLCAAMTLAILTNFDLHLASTQVFTAKW